MNIVCVSFFFFFNDPSTTEIYTLSLHDALPISDRPQVLSGAQDVAGLSQTASEDLFKLREQRPEGMEFCEAGLTGQERDGFQDRKSTRLNSSHVEISYAVFCLKKKKVT